jgi:hypothetical protein
MVRVRSVYELRRGSARLRLQAVTEDGKPLGEPIETNPGIEIGSANSYMKIVRAKSREGRRVPPLDKMLIRSKEENIDIPGLYADENVPSWYLTVEQIGDVVEIGYGPESRDLLKDEQLAELIIGSQRRKLHRDERVELERGEEVRLRIPGTYTIEKEDYFYVTVNEKVLLRLLYVQ